MEKMGWKKGEGLGRDSNGMTSCLVLKKADGSNSQGRIEQAAPLPAMQQAPTNGLIVGADAASQFPIALHSVPGDPLGSSIVASLVAAEAAASRGDAGEEQSRKRRRHGFDSDPTDDQSASVVADAAMESIAPSAEITMPNEADFIIAAARAAADIQMMGLNGQLPEATAFAGSADGVYVVGSKSGNSLAGTPSANPGYGGNVSSEGVTLGPGCGGHFPSNRKRVRQWVVDDWRWSKGTDALRAFEEVTLPPGLVDMAKKVLGKESRYPARISDDTDCVVEVTAWGTLLVRPRGSGAHIALAKRMIYQVLHPQAGPLRNEALIEEDAEHEAAIRDFTTISQTEGRDEKELESMVERSAQNKMSKVGLGGYAPNEEEQQVTRKEIPLPTSQDITLARKNLNNLRLETGVQALLNGANLVVVGQDAQVSKAEVIVGFMVETGQWVSLNDNFVPSEETKEKRKVVDGPSEQLLIKIPEGQVVQLIQTHLAVMEKAAEADKLKLTSKAVMGKRTLMVDGHRRAHERIKLMVREISEKGESPMLNKALGIKTESPAATQPPQSKAELASDLASSLGVPEEKVKPPIVSSKPLAGGGIRNLPAPRLATQMGKGDDLFADLPAPKEEPPAAELPAAATPAPAAPAKPTVLRASDIFGAPAGARGVAASVAAKTAAQPTSLIGGLLATAAESKEALAARAASDAAEQELLDFYQAHAAAIAAPVTE